MRCSLHNMLSQTLCRQFEQTQRCLQARRDLYDAEVALMQLQSQLQEENPSKEVLTAQVRSPALLTL